ncbi:RagB/SusD family nutrient uptake outer membrane protein [Psychroserpens sp. XS_ASV72]|uniref:RagB/SusD family nutrient uptake outer membrane protein n=1 Tax=Psychroserpens sp. XS_ASV72 TaxID=3241293 RepID=UPI00351602D7
MKKVIIIAILSMFFATSCNDALDILPEDSIPAENAFTNVADLQNGLNAIYFQYNPQNMIDYSSNYTDDTKIGADNGGQKVGFHQWVLQANSAESQNMWLNCYATINSINRVLEAASTIAPANAAEAEQYDKILGDCYALRAYLHLEVLAHYGVGYGDSDAGVPISNFVVVFEQLPRSTAGEVFEFINNDLDTAMGLIDASYTDNGYVTRDFITAVRARAALYSGASSTALTATQALMDKYPLADQGQYINMFANDTDNTEVIFKLYRTNGNNDPRVGGVWYFTGTGGAFMEMSNGFYDAVTADPSDIRAFVNIDPLTDDANNLHFIGKYPGKEGFDYLNDVKVFRVSEMYLIRAEILAKSGDYNGAASLLKDIRDARTGGDTALSGFNNLPDAMDEILAERRLELAYEGFRFVDVKRTRSITNDGFDRNPADCGGAVPCQLASTDYRFTFPIPVAELNGNPNITQAPGY